MFIDPPATASAPEPFCLEAGEALRVGVVGAGYVGLVSAACLAGWGHRVWCMEQDPARLATLAGGRAPFHEPALEALLATLQGRLQVGAASAGAIGEAELILLAVGTPPAPDGGQADLSQFHAAVDMLLPELGPGAVLALKSTLPVGTADALAERVRGQRPDVAVVSNPEFLREGHAVEDFERPARIVLGCEDAWAADRMRRLYAPLLRRGVPLLSTRRRTAELVKYAANAFLATRLAFVNELADLCEHLGADVLDVTQGLGLDPRIGPHYLRPGPGYGGSCLPKDLQALIATGRTNGRPLAVVEAVATSHALRPSRIARKVIDACGGQVQGRVVALLGVAFKADTDDVRCAPALGLAAALQAAGAAVRWSDPQALPAAHAAMPDVPGVDDPYACAEGADALVLVTDWPEYLQLDLHRMRALMRTPLAIDLRNQWDPAAVRAAGLRHVGLGRGRGDGEGTA